MTADPDIVMLARGLTKVFVKNRTPYVAVRDVYFSVRAGECFGLLGVNGAGKSTCFKMLTGDLLPTDGDSSIKNKWLRSDRSSVSNLILGEFVFCSAYSQCTSLKICLVFSKFYLSFIIMRKNLLNFFDSTSKISQVFSCNRIIYYDFGNRILNFIVEFLIFSPGTIISKTIFLKSKIE